jgi:aminoglycoside 3-N-acetyltransferase
VYKELHRYDGLGYPGFAGNVLFDKAQALFLKNHPDYKVVFNGHSLGDDVFYNDSTIGMPTVWIVHNPYGYHHNSAQDETIMDVDAAAENFGFAAQWVAAMAAMTPEETVAILPKAVEDAKARLAAEAQKTVRPGTDMQARMAYLHRREVNAIRGLKLWGDPEEVDGYAAQIPFPENVGTAEEKMVATPFFDYTENFVFTRITRGFPHDMLTIPEEQRTVGYGGMLYQPFAEVFAMMDGKRTLKEAICVAEWEKGNVFSEKEIKKWLHLCILFSKHGYLSMEVKNALTQQDLVSALEDLGVKKGDTLLVHSGISNIGYLEGGADAMIGALKTVLGEEGTFLAPVFTDPYLMFDGAVNTGYAFRPYDTRPEGALRDKTVRTGLLGKTMLKREDSFRSGHATHEWVAMGKNAQQAVAGHGFMDKPTGETSPLRYALQKNGSVLFLGCDPGSNTFIHYAEIMAGIPFAEPVVMQYINDKGETVTTMMDGHLYGCRNFYCGIEDTYYKKAIPMGLRVYERKFGLTTLYRMELQNVYDITMQMYKDDPFATLCKDPDCPFCKRFGAVK